MFIGHDAAGLASKRVAPRTSLGWLLAAPNFLDLLWPVFLALGIEHVRIAPGITKFTPLDFYDYPWSHSLLMSIVWGVLFGGAYFFATRYARGAIVIGIGVVSHWIFDWIAHRPDLPLYPGGPKVGLGLWNSPLWTIIVEVALYVIGIAIYLRSIRFRNRTGVVAFWSLIILLALIYAANSQGKAPPSVNAIIVLAFAGYLIPLWGFWIDRHTEARV